MCGWCAASRRCRKDGVTILPVEQNVAAALAIADRAYVLEPAIVLAGNAPPISPRPARAGRLFRGVNQTPPHFS